MHHIVSWNSATPGMLVSQRKSSISYQPPLGHRISVYPTAHFVASDWSKRTHQHLKTLHPGRACSNRKTPGICIHIVIHSDLMKTWCDFWSLIHRIYVKLSPTKYIYIYNYIYIHKIYTPFFLDGYHDDSYATNLCQKITTKCPLSSLQVVQQRSCPSFTRVHGANDNRYH